MRVEPTFKVTHYRASFMRRRDQSQSRISSQFYHDGLRFRLHCKIAWAVDFDARGSSKRNVAHTIKLRVPQILPAGVSMGILDYFDQPYRSYNRSGSHVLVLPGKWRYSLSRIAQHIPVVDELPQETDRIEHWLERRLINCFTNL